MKPKQAFLATEDLCVLCSDSLNSGIPSNRIVVLYSSECVEKKLLHFTLKRFYCFFTVYIIFFR